MGHPGSRESIVSLVLLYVIIHDSELVVAPSGYVISSDIAELVRYAANDESWFDEFAPVCRNPASYAATVRWQNGSAEP